MDVEQFKRQQNGGSARRRPFTVVANEYVAPARVQVQRMMPLWMAKVRWVVLRGSKTPILAVYRHVSTFVMNENPIRVMLLGADTTVQAAGEKGMVITSHRVRRNDTWALSFESSGQRKRMYESIKLWIELSAFLQTLTGFESIARSQNSVVYRCHDRDDPQRVFALKRVSQVKCFNEIEVTEKLPNIDALQPYIPRYVFMFEDSKDNTVTIAMKYYTGGSLADRIREVGALPENIVRSVMASLCIVLFTLHQHNILHLDVKAANILFDNEGGRSFRNLKLVDFGCSVPYSSTEAGARVAEVAGTYGCMAPERFDGRHGREADVYSAGIVLYHMVAGEIPFMGSDSYQVMARNMNGVVSFAHPRWRRVSPQLMLLAKRMLEKDPDTRITFGEILKLSWLFQSHSKHDVLAPDASPPFPAYMTRSDPFAFFA